MYKKCKCNGEALPSCILYFYHYFYYSLTGDCFEKIQKQSRLVRHDISCAKCNDIALKEKGAPLPWKTMLIKIVL